MRMTNTIIAKVLEGKYRGKQIEIELGSTCADVSVLMNGTKLKQVTRLEIVVDSEKETPMVYITTV